MSQFRSDSSVPTAHAVMRPVLRSDVSPVVCVQPDRCEPAGTPDRSQQHSQSLVPVPQTTSRAGPDIDGRRGLSGSPAPGSCEGCAQRYCEHIHWWCMESAQRGCRIRQVINPTRQPRLADCYLDEQHIVVTILPCAHLHTRPGEIQGHVGGIVRSANGRVGQRVRLKQVRAQIG